MAEHMLTTVDNPFDPTKDFDQWNAWDLNAGYNTMAFLARVVKSSHDMSEADQSLAIELAIKEIADENVLGIYKRVEVQPSPNSSGSSDDEVYVDPALAMTE